MQSNFIEITLRRECSPVNLLHISEHLWLTASERSKCVSLLRKTKKAYYPNLNVKNIVDNKKFWKTVKSFFSNKSNSFENMSLIENGNLLTNDLEIAETFNKYFQNLVPNLDFKVPNNLLGQTPENGDKVKPQYLNTRIIQVSKQSSKNAILAFLSKQCHLLI